MTLYGSVKNTNANNCYGGLVLLNTLARSKVLELRTLIVLLAMFVTVMTLANGFHATYQVQREQLIKQALVTNHAYALKVAAATNNFIYAAHQQLAVSATLIANNFDDHQLMAAEADRLRIQTNSFNAVAIIDHEGLALAGSPLKDNIAGRKLITSGVIETLEAKAPLVSTPYTSTLGNLVTLISYPMFNKSGEYLGYVGGAIYLNAESILNDLLGQHFHEDGSYIYVVDKNRRLIYHPDSKRLGTNPLGDIVSHTALTTSSGYLQANNSLGIEMLAGFAAIESANWAVVAQRPVSATLSELDGLMIKVLFKMLPLALFTFLIIWIVADYISRPLRQLADVAQNLDSPTARNDLSKISSWYFESSKLRLAMLSGLGLLNTLISQLKKDADTDPLTGAFNRRSLHILLDKLHQERISFSALAIDIDHFKKVNDTFGHAGGDKALVALTQIIRQVCREQDIVARTGGEEFVLILPNTTADMALLIAERLRDRVANMHIEPIGSMTISIGIATCTEHVKSTVEVLDSADQALYNAKSLGRNRCEVFDSL